MEFQCNESILEILTVNISTSLKSNIKDRLIIVFNLDWIIYKMDYYLTVSF
jgi:hypothetical protein